MCAGQERCLSAVGKPHTSPSGKERNILATQPAGDRMLSHQEWEEEASVSVTRFQNRIPDPAACDFVAGSLLAIAKIPLTGQLKNI